MNQQAWLALAAAWLLGLGLIIGSFLNVVIARVPSGHSVVRPRSQCPGCQATIRARDNLPVISWCLLRGRCRSCGMRISARYPAVEIANGVLWLLLGTWTYAHGTLAALPGLLVVGSAGVALAVIDVEHHRLPNAIVLPLLGVSAVSIGVTAAAGQVDLWVALAGAGIWTLLIGLLWLVSGGRGMGLGDVKLAPSLGAAAAVAGLGASLVGLGLSFVLGGLVGAGLLITGRARRGTRVPFGPFLLGGALLGLLVGQPAWQAYRALAGW
jgi:leader peptidase (prepilin peptidase)/N-methyltransferase